MCEVALVTHGESGKSRVGFGGFPRGMMDASSPQAQFESPYGPTGAPSTFPIGVLRYMKTYGLTHEQLAMVAVVQRQWASQNPRAMMRDLITVDDVMTSRMVAYPMHLFECCLVTDGGGALGADVGRTREGHCPQPPVYVLGTGESSETPMISQMEDFTTSKAFRVSGEKAFDEAGIAHEDVDHLMIYDAFAHLPIYGLEALGFVGPGEAGAFIEEGNTAAGWWAPDEHQRRRACRTRTPACTGCSRSRSRSDRCAARRRRRFRT